MASMERNGGEERVSAISDAGEADGRGRPGWAVGRRASAGGCGRFGARRGGQRAPARGRWRPRVGPRGRERGGGEPPGGGCWESKGGKERGASGLMGP
jgi:hypothetical protein